jgi:hypothetical protein
MLDRSPASSLARAEQVVTLLRTSYIREGWKIDDEAAEVALAYCRQYAADGSDPDGSAWQRSTSFSAMAGPSIGSLGVTLAG